MSSFSSSLHPRGGFGLPLSCVCKARSIPGAGHGFGGLGNRDEGTLWQYSQ